MLNGNKKQYVLPALSISTFECLDVITASNADNLGGIPNTWYGINSQGGDFE